MEPHLPYPLEILHKENLYTLDILLGEGASGKVFRFIGQKHVIAVKIEEESKRR
jgi:hypothetical protein